MTKSSPPDQSQGEPQQRRQHHVPASQTAAVSSYVNPQYLSGGPKSLSGISSRAYGLGIALGICSLLSAELAYQGSAIWRAPFFIVVLSIFHYLEFDSTARYNPSDASTSSFLLLSNGIPYSIAHATAMLEVLLRFWLLHSKKSSSTSSYSSSSSSSSFSSSSSSWSYSSSSSSASSSSPSSSSWWTVNTKITVPVGLAMVAIGQLVRVAAMRKAKTNFNHLVQVYKKDDHQLVTDGVYALSRHPSYFGFFCWALGTQIVLGNFGCFVVYAVVLWRFFSHRIMHEERYLVQFFGKEYIDYRQRVPTLIPFIR